MSACKISQTLPRLLSERKLTQTQLAKKAGVPLSTVSAWLNPNAKPRDPEAVFRVAQVLGVTLEELLFDQAAQQGEMSLEKLLLKPILDGFYRLKLERVQIPTSDEKLK